MSDMSYKSIDELVDDLRPPLRYTVYYRTLLRVDRILFGQDESIRRTLLGFTPMPLRPLYNIYYCMNNRRAKKIFCGVPDDVKRIVAFRVMMNHPLA
jgi:hypothetical protein